MIEDRIDIAANSTNPNVIASNNALRRLNRAPFPAKGILMITAGAAGLQVSLSHGAKEVVNLARPRVGTDIQYPQDAINEDWYVEEGEILSLQATNPTGGTIGFSYRIILEPLSAEELPGGQLPPDSIVMQNGPISIPAATFNLDLLDGLRYQRPPTDSIMTLLMTSSALGLTREVFVDLDSIAPPSALPPVNRIPMNPFDTTLGGIEVPEDKPIAVQVTNTTAGALSVFWRIVLKQMVRR